MNGAALTKLEELRTALILERNPERCHCEFDVFSLDILQGVVRHRCLRCMCMWTYEWELIGAPQSCHEGTRRLYAKHEAIK